AILARIRFVADANQCHFKQTYDRGQHLLARQPLQEQISLHRAPEFRQRFGEGDQAVELACVAHGAPALVISILLSSPGITARRLQVPAWKRTNSHLGPCRRNGQLAHARKNSRVRNRSVARIHVTKSSPCRDPSDAWPVV